MERAWCVKAPRKDIFRQRVALKICNRTGVGKPMHRPEGGSKIEWEIMKQGRDWGLTKNGMAGLGAMFTLYFSESNDLGLRYNWPWGLTQILKLRGTVKVTVGWRENVKTGLGGGWEKKEGIGHNTNFIRTRRLGFAGKSTLLLSHRGGTGGFTTTYLASVILD